MQTGKNDALGIGLQVDQQVAADQQVDPGDGRVTDHVVAAEDDAFAQFALKHVVVVGSLEIAFQQRLRNGFDLARRIGGVACRVQGRIVQVGGVYLDPPAEIRRSQHLGEEHRQGVGLLTRRAADAPDADRSIAALPLQNAGNDIAPQHVPGVAIAEEGCDVDQDGVQKIDEFLGMGLQESMVCGEAVAADLFHPPADAPFQARALVTAEVNSTPFLDVANQAAEIAVGIFHVFRHRLAYPPCGTQHSRRRAFHSSGARF